MKTFYARGAYGRTAWLADWNSGKDFQCVASGRYFSIRDIEYLKQRGHTRILFIANADFNRPIFIVRLDDAKP